MKRHRVLLFSLVLIVCVGCDQTTKELAEQALSGSGAVSLAGDVLRLELVQNPGAFMSIGDGLAREVRTLLFVVLAPIGMLVAFGLALWSGFTSWPPLVGLAMIAGGGLGNWLDRLSQNGSVTDFASLGVGPLRTGIFNLADVFILAGAAVVLFWHRSGTVREKPRRVD